MGIIIHDLFTCPTGELKRRQILRLWVHPKVDIEEVRAIFRLNILIFILRLFKIDSIQTIKSALMIGIANCPHLTALMGVVGSYGDATLIDLRGTQGDLSK